MHQVVCFVKNGPYPSSHYARHERNIIADRVETVAPWLVDRILENKKHGARISWASRGRMIFRFLTAPLIKRDLFADEQVV